MSGEREKEAAQAVNSTDPIRIDAPELAHLDFEVSTGGLKTAPGLATYTVVRADKEHPEAADDRGWTYQHHPDLAAWHGRLYVGWDSCEKDEDVWPSRELLSWSTNGQAWSHPVEMFPQGVSTALRMYFYLAHEGTNARMLVIAGLRVDQEKLNERKKGGLVVRELKADHTFGPVFMLRATGEEKVGNPHPSPLPSDGRGGATNLSRTLDGSQQLRQFPPMYETCEDKRFVTACRQLLGDHVYLQQQDYGVLLDAADRLKWNEVTNWPALDDKARKEADNFGKAMCFFERKDGALVGVGKRRWVTISRDGGKTWDQPVQPASLVTGMGKVWGQRTSDGRYALVYNPDPARRWPLALLTSDDGVTFREPYALHGDLPKKRYEGKNKSPGASYHRGLSKWNDDGSWADKGLWLVYSLNKEEIRVIRMPMPIGK